MSKIANKIADAVADIVVAIRRVTTNPTIARYLPKRKVLVGALGAVLVAAARKIGVLDFLPAGWTEVVAYAVVAYLVPEPPAALPDFLPDPVEVANIERVATIADIDPVLKGDQAPAREDTGLAA